MKYDYLIVGAGLFGSVFAYEATKRGYSCLIIEKRSHIGGNIYTENVEGINVHKYGPHIFHTNKQYIWDYINQFATFNNFVYSPLANYKGEIYNLPFNMNTFLQMYGESHPEAVKSLIEETKTFIGTPTNLEEQAISMVGKDIYEKLVKEYTEKQWGKSCTELPPFIIKRLPLRFTYDNNYYNDRYQGIPVGGYTKIIEELTKGSEIRLNTDYFEYKDYYDGIANMVVYTGRIDKYFEFCYGKLDYRSLEFQEEILNTPNYQGVAAVNFTSHDVPYTRIIEHKHFEAFGENIYKNNKTVITKEVPTIYNGKNEPYYPINDEKNNALYEQYKKLAKDEENVIFGGRLAEYKYYNMDDVIAEAKSYWH